MTESDAIDVARLLAERNRLRAIARALLGDEHAAEDAASEATLRALESPPRDPVALPAWLGSVVRRVSLGRLREESRRTARERAAVGPSSSPAADEAVARVEIQRVLIDRVLALREPYRSAIVLRYFEDLSPPAIAARLEVPEKTVTSWLYRGLGILRSELDRQCPGGRRTWSVALLPVAGLEAPAAGVALHTAAVAGGLWVMSRIFFMAAVGLLLVSVVAFRLLVQSERPVGGESVVVSGPSEPRSGRAEDAEAEREVAARAEAPPTVAKNDEVAVVDPSDPNGALSIRVVFADGAEPEPVGLLLRGPDDGADDGRLLETDASGRVLVEALAPGAYHVSALRGGSVDGEVRAGQATRLELELPRGVDVHGEVVDAAGAPVPYASVWLHKEEGWVGGRVEVAADASGRFVLRSVDPSRSLAAFADGYLPSGMRPIGWGERSGDVVSMRIPLGETAATLRGRVIDEWKRPVVGARVAVWGGPPERGFINYERPRLLLRTDEDGNFATTSARTPHVVIAVSAPGFAPYATAPDVDETLGAEVTIQLDQGVTLQGTAYQENGLPASDVVIEVTSRSVMMFKAVTTRTGRDGRYTLDRLPRFPLQTEARHGDVVVRGEPARGPGGTLSWDPVLVLGAAVRGRVVDADGVGIEGLNVFALENPHKADVGQATTGVDGSFMISAVQVKACCLRVEDPDTRAILAVSSWLRVGGPPCRLVVDHATQPSAFLVGQFEDDAGEADGAFVSVMATLEPGTALGVDGLERAALSQVESGSFRLGPIRPGRWRLLVDVMPSGKWLAAAGPWEVAAGETVDVGVLRTVPSGTVTARVADVASLDGRWMHASLSDPVTRWGCPVVREDDEFVARGVPPGTYELQVLARGYLDARVPVEVRSGEGAVVDVHLVPGVDVRIELVPPDEAPWWKVTTLRVRDSAGAPRLDWSAPFYPNQAVITAPGRLPVGDFTVEAWTDTGLRTTGHLKVPRIGDPVTTRLELK